MTSLAGWLVAFGLTLVIELPIYGFLLRPWCRPWVGACWGLVANVITHPALWFGLSGVEADGWHWAWVFASAETAVWLVEWLVLAVCLRGRRADGDHRGELGVIAALANLVSAGIGLVLQLR